MEVICSSSVSSLFPQLATSWILKFTLKYTIPIFKKNPPPGGVIFRNFFCVCNLDAEPKQSYEGRRCIFFFFKSIGTEISLSLAAF